MDDVPTNVELERLFDEHGIPRRRLYPFWYRLNQWLGIKHRPPVTFRFGQHVLCHLPAVIVVVIAAAGLEYWIYDTNPRQVLALLFFLVPAVPVMSWFSYRRIRRRIGLEP